MPVEVITTNSVMYNKPREGFLAECVHVFPGDIISDEDFPEWEQVKDKSDASLVQCFRYLSPAQAKTLQKDLDDRAALEAEVGEDADPIVASAKRAAKNDDAAKAD